MGVDCRLQKPKPLSSVSKGDYAGAEPQCLGTRWLGHPRTEKESGGHEDGRESERDWQDPQPAVQDEGVCLNPCSRLVGGCDKRPPAQQSKHRKGRRSQMAAITYTRPSAKTAPAEHDLIVHHRQ